MVFPFTFWHVPESFVECKKCPKCHAIMGLDNEGKMFVCGCGFKMPAITRSGIQQVSDAL